MDNKIGTKFLYVINEFQNNAAEGERKVKKRTGRREFLQRIFTQKLFCDLTLVATKDSTEVLAHQCIVGTANNHFSNKISDRIAAAAGSVSVDDVTDVAFKSRRVTIEVNDIDGEILKAFIAFLYTEEIVITRNNCFKLLEVSLTYQCTGIQTECKRYFEDQLYVKPVNCFYIHQIASKYSWNRLMAEAVKTAAYFFPTLASTQPFFRIDYSLLDEIVKNDYLINFTEEEIFNSVRNWINFDHCERSKYVQSLLELIDFSKMTSKFVIEHVKDVCMSSGCQSFYVRLIEHTAIPEMNFYRFDDTNNIIRRITAKMLIAAGTDARDRTTTATYCPQNDTWDNMQRLRSDKNDGVSTNKTKTRIVAVVHHFKSNCSRSKQIWIQKKLFAAQLTAAYKKAIYLATIRNKIYSYSAEDKKLHCYDELTQIGRTFDLPKNLMKCVKGVAFKDRLYIYGPKNNATVPDLYYYDTVQNEWHTVIPMNYSHKIFDVVVAMNHLYVIGDEKSEKYDLDADSWTDISPFQWEFVRITLAPYKNGLAAIAVNAGDTLHAKIYDQYTNTWKQINSPSIPMKNIALNYLPYCFYEQKSV